jgi:hypothetical protein
MEFLGLFSRGVRVVALGIVLRGLVVIDFDEERDWDALKLCSLALLVNAVFFEIQDIADERQFLLQFRVMRYIFSICVEPY